jgi:hypothetical protein
MLLYLMAIDINGAMEIIIEFFFAPLNKIFDSPIFMSIKDLNDEKSILENLYDKLNYHFVYMIRYSDNQIAHLIEI